MASGITKAAQVTDTINTYIAEARLTRMHKTVMEGLVDTITMKEGDQTIQIPKFGTVTIAKLSEGVDMANPQQLSTSSQTFTTSEYGAQTILTDVMVFKSQEDVTRRNGRIMGDAMAKQLDTDLLGLFSAFTGATIGDGSTAFTMGYMTACHAILIGRSEPAPEDSIVCVVHPYHIKDILDQIIVAGGPHYEKLAEEGARKGLRGINRLLDIPIYASGNITITSSKAYGALYAKESIIHVKEKQWNIEPERNASLRATELNVVARYGFGHYDKNWGGYLYFDATTPTS